MLSATFYRRSQKDPMLDNAQKRNMALQFSHGRPRERTPLPYRLSSQDCVILPISLPLPLAPSSTLFSRRDCCYLRSEMQVKRIGGKEGGGRRDGKRSGCLDRCISRHSVRSKVQESVVAQTANTEGPFLHIRCVTKNVSLTVCSDL